MIKSTLIYLALAVSFSVETYAQALPDNLPKLMPSSLVNDVQARIKEHPKISAADLADFANARLAETGYEFRVDPCDIASTATTLSYPGEYAGVFYVYHVKDPAASETSFLAREPGDAPCGCWLNLPLKRASQKSLVVISDRGSVEISPPKELLLEEVELVDQNLRKSVRTWVVSEGGPPDGISTDGKKLYLETEIRPLFLEIAEDGTLKFVPRRSASIITRHSDLKKFPGDSENDYLGYRRFSNGRRSYTVKFTHICT